MRPWLLLKHFEVEFEEVSVELFVPGYKERLSQFSPAGKVPVLLDNSTVIWDSLAICEYISETYLQGRGLPENAELRATCRAVSYEMHGGFMAIRNELPMNCRSRKSMSLSEEVKTEVDRVSQIWCQSLEKSGGPYLFGDFSIADCMFAPVVMRFLTYGVVVNSRAVDYMSTVSTHEAVLSWVAAAVRDGQLLSDFEVGQDQSS